MKNDLLFKKCTKCGEQKDIKDFGWQNKSKGYKHSWCKDCKNKYNKKQREDHKDRNKEYMRQWYKNNKKRHKESMIRWREGRKDYAKQQKKYMQQWYKNNKEWRKEYRKNNKESISIVTKLYYENNKERLKKHRRDNKSTINRRIMDRLHTDPIFKLKLYIPTQIRKSLKAGKSGRHWEDLVGYTIMDLKLHLERQFKPGMFWENYGEWHIDHCKPVSWFKKTEKELLKAWKLDNLQPMWANENLIKGNRWESPRIVTTLK